MRFNTLSAIALSCGIAHALPAEAPEPTAAPELMPRVDGNAPWVSVDKSAHHVTTYTPTYTTIDGSTSYVDTARHDLTASLYTWTTYGKIHTSTGEPPNPTADSSNGQGSFSRCFNKDGEHSPFCFPRPNSTLLLGRTYYITWDPEAEVIPQDDKKSNVTHQMSLEVDFLNKTSNELEEVPHIKKPKEISCKKGFLPLTITKEFLHGHRTSNNVTIKFFTSVTGSQDYKDVPYLLNVTVEALSNPEPSKSDFSAKKLAIALPVVVGGIVLLVIGIFLWNRKTRRIQLGNVMSRSRHGYSGRQERRKLFRADDHADIALDNSPRDAGAYHDEPTRPRRDSDGLGSLAGSPVDGSFEQQGTTGGRNAFRDEMARQHTERHERY